MNIQYLRDKFYLYGWLMPVLLPIAETIGRAVFNLVFYVYLLWALADGGRYPRLKKVHWFLFFGLLVAFGLSVANMPSGQEQANSFEQLVKYMAHALVFVITLKALQENKDGQLILMRALGIVGVVVVIILTVMLIYFYTGPNFDRSQLANKDTLPWLVPFSLWLMLIMPRTSNAVRFTLSGLLLVPALIYILLSEGRTALLSLIVAAGGFYWLYLRLNWRKVLAGLVVLASILFVSMPYLLRGAHLDGGGMQSYVDKLSSGRTVLWRQALESPPPSILFGVGFSNAEGKQNVTYIGNAKVRHLHNVILDCWYETGLVGLSLFVAWIFYHMVLLCSALKTADENMRRKGIVLLCSILAILVAGLVTMGHASRLFGIYLFLLFAMVAHMTSPLTPDHKTSPEI